MTIRRPLSILAFLVPVCALLLAGCGNVAGGGSASPSSGSDASAGPPHSNDAVPDSDDAADPLVLIGLWRVSDAEGGDESTYLRLDARDLILWRECGYLLGSWNTAGDTILLDAGDGGTRECFTDTGVLPAAWLTNTTGFQVRDGGAIELLDASGTPTATLTIDGAPASRPDMGDWLREPPVITDATRAWFAAPSALPPALTAATDIVGRWIAAAEPGIGSSPDVVFSADGTYLSSDGCNGTAGRWVLGADGGFLSTAGSSTLVGCEGAPVPMWIANATAVSAGVAATDAPTLTFWDASGAELGSVVG